MTSQEMEQTKLCKHCGIMYPPTKDNFYTCNGKLKLDTCKGCKKEKSRKYKKLNPDKRIRVRDRKEYSKMYYNKKKLEKQELNRKDI